MTAGDQRAYDRKQLRYADIRCADIQTVGSQALDPRPAEAVPQNVQPCKLPVVFPRAAAQKYVQYDKPREVPQAFVKKRRVDEYRNAIGRSKSHAAEDIRFNAECLAVYKVAPAAYGLPDEQTERRKIAERENGYLLLFAHENTGYNACDYTSVDSEATVAQGQDLRRIGEKIIKLEQNVIQPCADYAGRDQPYYEVEKIIRGKAELRCLLCTEQCGEDKADGDYRTVKINFKPKTVKLYGGSMLQLPSMGKLIAASRSMVAVKKVIGYHAFTGEMTLIASLSGVMNALRKSSHSPFSTLSSTSNASSAQ